MINRAVLISRTILVLGIIWGIASLLVGLAASFVLNDIDLPKSLLVLFAAFLAPLAAAILAIWRPWLASIVLVISILLLQGLGILSDGLAGVIPITRRFGAQSILFICGYLFVAHLKGKVQASAEDPGEKSI
jgi:hypothetical protein